MTGDLSEGHSTPVRKRNGEGGSGNVVISEVDQSFIRRNEEVVSFYTRAE